MPTYGMFCNDVLQSIQQLGDDRKVTFEQIVHWTQVCVNQLRTQSVIKHRDSGRYLNHYVIEVESSTTKKFFTLPALIVDYDNDIGIDWMSYEKKEICDRPITFQRTDAAEVKNGSLYDQPYLAPSPTNPYFYREGSIIHLIGVECVEFKRVDAGLKTLITPDIICNIYDDIGIDEGLERVLFENVFALARTALLITQEKQNDGSSAGTQIRTTDAITAQRSQAAPQQEQPQ